MSGDGSAGEREMFPDLGLDIRDIPNGVAEFFDPKRFLSEETLRELATSNILANFTSGEFVTSEAIEEIAHEFAAELTDKLSEAGLLGETATFVGQEISVRRRYVQFPPPQNTVNDDGEEIDDENQPEPKTPRDPAILKEKVTDQSITGELSLLPANQADLQDNSIITGQLMKIIPIVIEVKDDPEDENEKPRYRVEFYYRILIASEEDPYEDNKLYALANVRETEVSFAQNTDVAGFKEALMILDNLDDSGRRKGEPMVNHHDLLSLVRKASVEFNSLRFLRANLTDINYLACLLQAEYQGKDKDKLCEALEILLSTCFRIGPQSSFYIECYIDDDGEEASVLDSRKRRAFIGKANGIIFKESHVTWKRKGEFGTDADSPVPIPHLVITREKDAGGRGLTAESKETFVIPLVNIIMLSPRFFEVY